MQMTNALWTLFFLLIQPLFLIGLGFAFWNRNKRIKYVRKEYRTNFNRSFFEVSDFFLKAIIPSIILSVLSVLIGLPLTIEWFFIYQAVTIILLLIGGARFIHPFFTFPLTSISIYILKQFNQSPPLGILEVFNRNLMLDLSFQTDQLPMVIFNSLVFVVLLLASTVFLLNGKDSNKLYPVLKSSNRGKTVAKYQHQKLWLLPLAVIVPGEVFQPFASWWPFFNIGGQDYTVLLLPVLLGLHFTVSTQLIEEAIENLKRDFTVLLAVLAVLTGVIYIYPEYSIFSAGIALIGGFSVLYRHRRRENLWSFKYGPADEGLRVISIRPDSPAERMNLSIGDIITDINDYKMTSKDQFYEVLTHNRSYIKMRVKRKDGEIVIADTPLFDDDVNNLGLLVL